MMALVCKNTCAFTCLTLKQLIFHAVRPSVYPSIRLSFHPSVVRREVAVIYYMHISVQLKRPRQVVAFSMNLNKASQKQIMEVQLIGEVLSKRIVKHRPFSSWAEVKTLTQIGDKRLQKLKAVFTIEIAEAASDDEEFQLVEKVKSAAERTITEASATEQRSIGLVQVFKFRIKC